MKVAGDIPYKARKGFSYYCGKFEVGIFAVEGQPKNARVVICTQSEEVAAFDEVLRRDAVKLLDDKDFGRLVCDFNRHREEYGFLSPIVYDK